VADEVFGQARVWSVCIITSRIPHVSLTVPPTPQQQQQATAGQACLFGLHRPDHILSLRPVPIEVTARLQSSVQGGGKAETRAALSLKQYVMYNHVQKNPELALYVRYPRPNPRYAQ